MPGGVQYLALLRGVNVGGKNKVPMAELREVAKSMGLDDVATFIASGNLLFRAPRQRAEALAARLETELSARFALNLKVVLQTEAQLRRVVQDAPRGFGAKTDRCDVIFLRNPLTPKRALGVVELKEGVDRVWIGPGVLYFSRLAAKSTSSRMARIVGTPEYQDMTIRSWSTTSKLLALVDSRT
jgi:uncharacterized protein (DUF1697 family)